MSHVMDRFEGLLNEDDDASDAGGSAQLESVVESAPVDDTIVDEDATVDHTFLGVQGQEREWYRGWSFDSYMCGAWSIDPGGNCGS